MPDWECGNVPFDIIPSAGPVRAGRAIQQKQEKGVFRSDQLGNKKREAKALLYSVTTVIPKLRVEMGLVLGSRS